MSAEIKHLISLGMMELVDDWTDSFIHYVKACPEVFESAYLSNSISILNGAIGNWDKAVVFLTVYKEMRESEAHVSELDEALRASDTGPGPVPG